MKKNITNTILASLYGLTITVHAYEVKASNFYRPRPKTLRRIARNLYLAIAIDKIYNNPRFTAEQQELLKSLPIFIRNTFTPNSIIQMRNGQRVSVEELQSSLAKLERTIISILSSGQSNEEAADFSKILKAINDLMEVLNKASEQPNAEHQLLKKTPARPLAGTQPTTV